MADQPRPQDIRRALKALATANEAINRQQTEAARAAVHILANTEAVRKWNADQQMRAAAINSAINRVSKLQQANAGATIALREYARAEASHRRAAVIAAQSLHKAMLPLAQVTASTAAIDRMMATQTASVRTAARILTKLPMQEIIQNLSASQTTLGATATESLGIDLAVIERIAEEQLSDETDLAADQQESTGLDDDDEFLNDLASTIYETLDPRVGRDVLGDAGYLLAFVILLSWWAAFVIAVPVTGTITTIVGAPGVREMHKVAMKVRAKIETGFESRGVDDETSGDPDQ